jgi:hypothetical protein
MTSRWNRPASRRLRRFEARAPDAAQHEVVRRRSGVQLT